MTDLPVTIADIRKAEAAIAGAVARTPLIRAAALSELAGCEVHLKLETMHSTGSFKERGALNKLLTLGNAERKAGVVAMSAGNHAQGVAYHARRLGIHEDRPHRGARRHCGAARRESCRGSPGRRSAGERARPGSGASL